MGVGAANGYGTDAAASVANTTGNYGQYGAVTGNDGTVSIGMYGAVPGAPNNGLGFSISPSTTSNYGAPTGGGVNGQSVFGNGYGGGSGGVGPGGGSTSGSGRGGGLAGGIGPGNAPGLGQYGLGGPYGGSLFGNPYGPSMRSTNRGASINALINSPTHPYNVGNEAQLAIANELGFHTPIALLRSLGFAPDSAGVHNAPVGTVRASPLTHTYASNLGMSPADMAAVLSGMAHGANMGAPSVGLAHTPYGQYANSGSAPPGSNVGAATIGFPSGVSSDFGIGNSGGVANNSPSALAHAALSAPAMAQVIAQYGHLSPGMLSHLTANPVEYAKTLSILGNARASSTSALSNPAEAAVQGNAAQGFNWLQAHSPWGAGLGVGLGMAGHGGRG